MLGVDHFLDMARSATNVMGNAIASSVVAKLEGELTDSVDADDDDLQGNAVLVEEQASR